jgi:ketosteroid isomerase-like protein
MRSSVEAYVGVALVMMTVGCAHGAAARGAEGVDPMEGVDATHDGFSLDVYRNVVRGKVIDSFARLSQGDPSRALGLMAPDVEYTFEGAHALGGTRVSRAGVEKWFARLLRLLPGKFTLRSVEVVGAPWRSTVYTVFEDVVTPQYGEPYRNHGVQIVELRWGSAVRIHTYVDTAKVERALGVLAAHGMDEAKAAPIVE